ncbi:sigma factor-like helix-turn-helix DNA-binding protein [Aliarcobacter butzleri]
MLEDRNFRKMTHRQIAEKHNISYPRVKQILDTLEKIKKYYKGKI